MSKSRHVPERTCVGCRTTSAKREFVRVIRTPEGAVELDPTGKRNGRGAYLCSRHDCWEQALKKDRLARALRTTISAETQAMLRQYAERLEPTAATANT